MTILLTREYAVSRRSSGDAGAPRVPGATWHVGGTNVGRRGEGDGVGCAGDACDRGRRLFGTVVG
jgi:hypothetical protein